MADNFNLVANMILCVRASYSTAMGSSPANQSLGLTDIYSSWFQVKADLANLDSIPFNIAF